jgi:histidine triad (HIT) family protein
VFETGDVFAFRDLNPQAPHHILVVPKRHIEKLADVTESDVNLMGSLLHAATLIAHDLSLDEQGYRVVVNNGETAGQSVWHLHLHLLSGRAFHWPPG